MTDLERRALLGDREAQEECTRQGIVLPCPICGGMAGVGMMFTGIAVAKCPKCRAIISFRGAEDKDKFLAAWNTHHAPPIVRCRECKHYKTPVGAVGGWCECELTPFDTEPDGFCSYGESKGGQSNE